MSEKWQNVLVTAVGTFVFALAAAKVLPSQMNMATWADVLWSSGIQAFAMGVVSLGYHAQVVQTHLLGREL